MLRFWEKDLLYINRYLAKVIGLNEAMVLNKINNCLESNKKEERNYHDGRYWTCNTINGWQKEFPFWSKETVKRTFKKLRDMNILITANYNKTKMDKTLWYSIDYEELDRLLLESDYPVEINIWV